MALRKIFAMLLLTLLIGSCGPGKVADQQHRFSDRCWPRSQSLTFTFPISDTAASYDIGARVGHFDNFPFDRVQLSFVLDDPSGESRTSEHDLVVRNKDGRFLGERVKDTFRMDFALRNHYRFKAAGIAKVTLVNRLPVDTTRGIGAIGLTVRKVH